MPVSEYPLGPKEAAAYLGVHEDTLKRWADAGHIVCWRSPGKHRRFRAEDLDAFLASRPADGEAATAVGE